VQGKGSNTEVETIKEMAKLSLVFNKINDIQIKNLQMFPLIFFNGVKSATIDYDFSNDFGLSGDAKKNSFLVSYKLNIDETAENSNLDKRFDALANSVRGLFWNGIKVEVFFNEKLVFGGTDV
jgi:hypothetical protein